MKYKEARQLVLENMAIVYSRQRKPDTFVEIRAEVFGQVFAAWDTAKYNLADEKREGVKFSAKFGMRLATGRAVKRIAKRVMRAGPMRLGIGLTATVARIESRDDGDGRLVRVLAGCGES